MKKALITGITGQDGSYLTELLLEKGYEVHGIIRRQSSQNTERIDHILNDSAFAKRVFLHYGDLTDSSNAHGLIQAIQPDEVYNLAAQSHVAVSFERAADTLLSGIDFRTFWWLARDGTSERVNSILSEESLWGGKALFVLDYEELSRVLWAVCVQWNPLQS